MDDGIRVAEGARFPQWPAHPRPRTLCPVSGVDTRFLDDTYRTGTFSGLFR